MADELFLVTGGTGKTGKRVAQHLQERGVAVRSASRSTDPPLDWTDERTWGAVLDGVHALYLAPAEGSRATSAFARRAAEAGVRRIVLLSARGVDTPGYYDRQDLLAASHLEGEAGVRTSGASWTVVRPGWFMQNFDEGDFLDAVRAGRLELPTGDDGSAAWIDAEDIAAVVAALLVEGGHEGETIELTGPRGVPVREAVQLVAAAAGRPVEFAPVSEAAYLERLRAEGLDEHAAAVATTALSPIRAGREAAPTDGVRRVLGRDPVSFEDYADRSASAWAERPPRS